MLTFSYYNTCKREGLNPQTTKAGTKESLTFFHDNSLGEVCCISLWLLDLFLTRHPYFFIIWILCLSYVCANKNNNKLTKSIN